VRATFVAISTTLCIVDFLRITSVRDVVKLCESSPRLRDELLLVFENGIRLLLLLLLLLLWWWWWYCCSVVIVIVIVVFHVLATLFINCRMDVIVVVAWCQAKSEVEFIHETLRFC
jgi:hypothetical protein